jgi:hypothetical protein
VELEKIRIHRNQEINSAVSQITLDDDYNVPDYRPDILKVLKEKGELRFDEVKVGNGVVWMKGSMIFRVLYRSEQTDGKISCLRGEIPFQEKLNLEGVTEYDVVRNSGEIEDITIGVINSRKLSVRAVVTLRTLAEREVDQELTTGSGMENSCQQNTHSIQALRLLVAGKDVCRQKSEILLPSSKPNVREILWKSVELRNVESFLKNETAGVTGEIQVSVLYSEEDEGDRLQWYETTVPLECQVDCDIDTEQCIYQIKASPISAELEVKPDYDGEERIFVLELALDLDIHVWREENLEILQDIYSLKRKLTPVRKECLLEKLLVKNYAKCRVTEQMELTENQEKILQICACEGTVMLEKKEPVENGVMVEGIVIAELLYITTDDRMPVGTAKEIYPFSQLIEIPEMGNDVRIEMSCGMEQMAAVMLDQEHIEVKALIHLDLMAFRSQRIQNIESVEEEPLDMEELQNLPGLVGYIANQGDSLWKIAKENHTTEADIMETNGRKDARLSPGEKILIVKNVG